MRSTIMVTFFCYANLKFIKIKSFIKLFAVIICFNCLFIEKATAQIIPDSTLDSESSKVNSINELRDRIEGGAIRGDALFHSFQEFNVGKEPEVYFANPNGIANIFSRVTGENISQILGTLGVEGTANLFLINPNGIVFGEDAAIDVGGSFLATTAESIEFADDISFSATNSDQLPMLKIEFPIGLGMGSNPGDIIIKGLNNKIVVEIPSFRVNTDEKPEGIRVRPEQNISLIGGNIAFDGGGITAEGGRVELGSVGDNQTIVFSKTETGWISNYDNVTHFQDISLLKGAYIDTSSSTTGAINIDGRQISVSDGSAILSNSLFDSSNTSNSIEINASELLELNGNFNTESNSISLIAADVLPDSIGNGVNIEINTDKLKMSDGAEIRAVNFSDLNNRTGQIDINAQEIEVTGTKPVDGGLFSRITNSTGINSGGGNGNDVNINTELLKVSDGASIRADTFGLGEAGNLKVNAQSIELSGANPLLIFQPSGLATSLPVNSETQSNSGNIFINTKILRITDGATIKTARGSSTETAAAGDIDIVAKKIELIGYSSLSPAVVSGIFSSVGEGAIGDGGNISIETQTLKILDGARIQADSGGSGSSGNIDINAQKIELRGTRSQRGLFNSGITTSTGSNNQNNGGNIKIESDRLTVNDGSQVRAVAVGSGSGGNIVVKAKEIAIGGTDRFGFGRVSGFYTNSEQEFGGNINLSSDKILLDGGNLSAVVNNVGQGGDIVLNTEDLELLNQSQISASARGEGNGGNMIINSNTILGLNNSDITANAVEGNGGNIEIFADGIVGIEARSELTPFSDITADSQLGIDGTVTIKSPESNADDEVVVSARELEGDQYEKLIEGSCLNPNRLGRGQLVYLGSGLPESPERFFDDEELIPDNELISPDAKGERYIGNAAEISNSELNQNIPPIWNQGEPLIESNAVQINPDGRKFLVSVQQVQTTESQICTRDVGGERKRLP